MDTKHIEQALLNLGYIPTTHRPGVIYGGFQVTSEDNGDTKITYVLGEYTGMRVNTAHRRKHIGSAISRMERDLSKQGWKVTMFQPDTGTDFWLKVQAEDAAYMLPGETEEAYTGRMETEADKAAWSRQDG